MSELKLSTCFVVLRPRGFRLALVLDVAAARAVREWISSSREQSVSEREG